MQLKVPTLRKAYQACHAVRPMHVGGAAWYFHTVGNSGLVDLRESQIKQISLFLISPEISKEERPHCKQTELYIGNT